MGTSAAVSSTSPASVRRRLAARSERIEYTNLFQITRKTSGTRSCPRRSFGLMRVSRRTFHAHKSAYGVRTVAASAKRPAADFSSSGQRYAGHRVRNPPKQQTAPAVLERDCHLVRHSQRASDVTSRRSPTNPSAPRRTCCCPTGGFPTMPHPVLLRQSPVPEPRLQSHDQQ